MPGAFVLLRSLGGDICGSPATTTEVESFLGSGIWLADRLAAGCLLPLCVWILLSGLDDLVVLLVFLYTRLPGRGPPEPDEAELEGEPEKRLAVFVPLWREEAVIASMLEHNLAAIRYRRYDFFVGAYPNDEPTLAAVRLVTDRFANVHLCPCPHDGPTSKADCLNWIFQRMLVHEDESGLRYDAVITHDAEDIIHPESFRWINAYLGRYEMVQTPVLAMPTPLRELTHGIYCDDFAEYHTKDMVVRQRLGGFVPSSGVGTGYRRDALERLAAEASNRLFEPGCLTEDYENGLRLSRLGCSQAFAPIRILRDGRPMATREYFPRRFRAALRQRTRWVTGIALQGWQRHGWRVGWRQRYWLWRDRKGLLGNPASLLANLLFVYGALTWVVARLSATPWTLGQIADLPSLRWLLAATLALGVVHWLARSACSARVYGWRFALGVPPRILLGNVLNAAAAVRAMGNFFWARLRHRPLVWVKTEHAYPSRAALMPHKRLLGEILVGSGYVSEEDLATALVTRPAGRKLGEHMVAGGRLREEDLYEALSLQQSLPLETIEPGQIRPQVARTLPARVIRQWQVLPFRIAEGQLYLASPNLPGDDLQRELRRFTHLEIRFLLVTPSNYKQLETALL